MKRKVGVSGGFDPIHIGHIRYLKDAAKLGFVQVYLTTDDWLIRKKGYRLVPWEMRRRLLEEYPFVHEVVPQLEDPDDTAAASLAHYRPQVFAKGGDRTINNLPEVEIEVCQNYNIEIVTGIGGKDKPASSSDLFRDAIKQYVNNNGIDEIRKMLLK
ncbi:MAG: adenylyltransferase/cytidyltransferase family protein [Planctomycetota bacterium]|jgi:D-beta-D-heptose 7-phosphate kinase/D-beta-D-heptose 1-phosphate adenosyltransferase